MAMVPALLELIVEVGRQTKIIPQLTSWQNQDSNSGLLDMRIHAFNHSPRCLPQPPLLHPLCCDVMVSNIHSAGSNKFQWVLPSKLLHRLRAVSFDPGPCDSHALPPENYSREDERIKRRGILSPPPPSISSTVPKECAPESSATINGRSESLISKIQELYYNHIPRFRNAQRHCERESSR